MHGVPILCWVEKSLNINEHIEFNSSDKNQTKLFIYCAMCGWKEKKHFFFLKGSSTKRKTKQTNRSYVTNNKTIFFLFFFFCCCSRLFKKYEAVNKCKCFCNHLLGILCLDFSLFLASLLYSSLHSPLRCRYFIHKNQEKKNSVRIWNEFKPNIFNAIFLVRCSWSDSRYMNMKQVEKLPWILIFFFILVDFYVYFTRGSYIVRKWIWNKITSYTHSHKGSIKNHWTVLSPTSFHRSISSSIENKH